MKIQSKFLFLAILILNGLVSPAFAAYETDTFKLAADTVNRTLKDRFKDVRNVKEWGAKCDGKELVDVTTTSGSAVISSASYSFTAADVGKKVYLYNSHDEGINTGRKAIAAETTIASVSAGNATLATTSTQNNTARARLVMYTTNDTTAINAAITALTPSGRGDVGATLKFPAGICMATQINVKRQVILEGESRNNTRLVQIGGTNSNFIVSENFATLTGTGANYGTDPNVPSWFGLKNIQIDGNRVYQTSGHCVAFYGNAQIWERTMVTNCKDVGMYTEAAATYAYNPSDWRAQEEGFFTDIYVRNVGSHGWQMRGPHDSTLDLFVTYGWGYNGTGYGFINEVNSPLYNGGGHFGQIHPYTSAGEKTSIYIGAGGDFQFLYSDFGSTTIASRSRVDQVNLLGCGIGGITPCLDITADADYTSVDQIGMGWNFSGLGTNLVAINVASGADSVTMRNIKGATFSSTTANNTLFKTRGNFGQFSGTVANMAGTGNICADLGGTYNVTDFTSYGCKTHVSYSAGSNNNMRLASFVNAGETAWSGSLSSTDVATKTDSNGANYTNLARGTSAAPGLTFGGWTTTGISGNSGGTNLNYSILGNAVGNWNAAGLTVSAGTLDLGVTGTTLGKIILDGNTSGAVTVQPAAAAGTWTMTLPTTAGTDGYLLKTDGAGVTTWVAPPSSIDLTAVNAWTGQQYFAQATLTDGANISWNLNTQQTALVTLGGNRTLDNPTNLVAGGTYTLIVKQDGTGSRTLAYGSAYKWAGGIVPVLTTAANSVDVLTFISDGTNMYGGVQYDMK